MSDKFLTFGEYSVIIAILQIQFRAPACTEVGVPQVRRNDFRSMFARETRLNSCLRPLNNSRKGFAARGTLPIR